MAIDATFKICLNDDIVLIVLMIMDINKKYHVVSMCLCNGEKADHVYKLLKFTELIATEL
jgi:hypothetical protein